MSHHPKDAFCPIYFVAHGGTLSDKGVPVFDGRWVPGLCGRDFDCGTCTELGRWVDGMAGWQIGWECIQCLKDTYLIDKSRGVTRLLPGFYQSSQTDDQQSGFIDGCTRCGWQTSFLQIILRSQSG